jgi:hypothetical protein
MAKHATIDEYIAAMPAPLAEVAAAARRVIDANLDGAESARRSKTRRAGSRRPAR